MGNSWKHAQILLVPQSDLCECGHLRKDHNNMRGYCWRCTSYGRVKDITEPSSDDVFGTLLEEKHIKSVIKNDDCKKFRKWSVERVRRFWNAANSFLYVNTKTEQTILDDYFSKLNI